MSVASLTLALLSLLAFTAQRLSAQTSDTARSPRDTLATVKVTVLRTPFDTRNAPVDVTSVGARDASVARPGFSLQEALGALAGIQVDNRLNFALGERIAIRGVGARAQFGVRGIRLLVDGIPATLADGQSAVNNIDLGSLGAVEVIRGPSSALYGNASGGVVSFITAPAPPVPFAPSMRVMSGSDGLRRVQFGAAGTEGNGTYVIDAGRLDYTGYRAFSSARNAHFNSVETWAFDRVALRLVANAVQYDAQNPGALSDSMLSINRRMAVAEQRHSTDRRARKAEPARRRCRRITSGGTAQALGVRSHAHRHQSRFRRASSRSAARLAGHAQRTRSPKATMSATRCSL